MPTNPLHSTSPVAAFGRFLFLRMFDLAMAGRQDLGVDMLARMTTAPQRGLDCPPRFCYSVRG